MEHQPAVHNVRVKLGRKSYRVAFDPTSNAVLYVMYTDAVRGERPLNVNGPVARGAILAARDGRGETL